MSFLDPKESIRIKELLSTGDPVAAAKLLLDSSNREHKAIRPLVTECVNQLITAAKTAVAENQVLTARDHARWAAELRPLSGDQAILRDQIESAAAEVERRAAAEKASVERSRKLADAGRLHTSIESLSPLQHLPEGKELRAELAVREGTLQRHKQECERLLEQGNLRGAEMILAKIDEVAPSSATALELRTRLIEAKKAEQPTASAVESPAAEPTTSIPDVRGWMLDFKNPELNTLLFFGQTVVIGSNKRGTSADIRVPGILLHTQHAVIMRHLRHDEMCYWLMPHPSHDKFVAVNGVQLTQGSDSLRPWRRSGKGQPADSTIQPAASELGCVLLRDGDVIQLGHNQHEAIRLVFRQRLEELNRGDKHGSCRRPRATASLQFEAASSGKFQKGGMDCDDLEPEFGYSNLALVHEEVRLGSPQRPVDLPLDMKFDCAIRYQLQFGKLAVHVEGGTTDFRVAGDDSEDENTVQDGGMLVLKKRMEDKAMQVIHRHF